MLLDDGDREHQERLPRLMLELNEVIIAPSDTLISRRLTVDIRLNDV